MLGPARAFTSHCSPGCPFLEDSSPPVHPLQSNQISGHALMATPTLSTSPPTSAPLRTLMVLGTAGPGAPPVPCLPQLSSTLPCGFSGAGLESNQKAGMGADNWLRPGRQGPDSSQNLSKACPHHRMTGTWPVPVPLGLEQGPVTSSLKI